MPVSGHRREKEEKSSFIKTITISFEVVDNYRYIFYCKDTFHDKSKYTIWQRLILVKEDGTEQIEKAKWKKNPEPSNIYPRAWKEIQS